MTEKRTSKGEEPLSTPQSDPALAERVEAANRAARERAEALGFPHPVGAVQWVHIDRVQANDYNPNAVAPHEMRLLYTSISEDGYTMPVVTIRDEEADKFIIVDGFHRYTTMRTQRDIYDSTGGYLPIVVIDKPLADRVASTVRHNRARGKHSVAGMSNLVFTMLREGESDTVICQKLGLEAEELQRLKYTTGFARLFENHEYSRPVLTSRQLQAKAEYAAAHPDEVVPSNI